MKKSMCKICTVVIIFTLLSLSGYAEVSESSVMKVVRINLWYQGIDNSKSMEYDSPEEVEIAQNSKFSYPEELIIPLTKEFELF